MAFCSEWLEHLRQGLCRALLGAGRMLLWRWSPSYRHHNQAVLTRTRGLGVNRLRRLAFLMAIFAAAAPLSVLAKPAPGVRAPYLTDLFPSTYQAPTAPDALIVHAVILDGAGHRLDDGVVL